MCDKGERVCDCELVSERENYDFHRERDIKFSLRSARSRSNSFK